MLVAAERLAASPDRIRGRRSLGYKPESAFSIAFTRVVGRSPREHARNGAGTAVGAT